MIRRLLHLYWRFARGLTLGVRGAVLNGTGEVLLVRHSYARGWHFPGGGVEPGETLNEALARELSEEGNVRLTGEPALHGIFYNPDASKRDQVAVFVVREFEWGGPLRPTAEILESRFFPLAALPDGTSAGTHRRLDEILRAAPRSARW